MLGIVRTEGVVLRCGHTVSLPAPADPSAQVSRPRLPGLVGALRKIPRRELLLVGAAMFLGLLLRVLYVRATLGHQLAGDEIEHDIIGRLFSEGHFMWSTTPYGDPHPTMTKAPLYPVLVGVGYSVLGENYDRVLTAQTLIGPVTVALSWVLARRLFGPKVGVAAAFVVALYPYTWQYETRLYSEAIAVPLVMLALILFLEREPTRARVVLMGLTLGLLMLTRPALAYLIVGVAVAWVLMVGWRRGLAATGVALVVGVLVLMPWMIRNNAEYDSFPLISWQDAAALYGTFNDEAAQDPVNPYAWRASNARDAPLFRPENRMEEDELRSKLNHNAIEFIKDHPDSLFKSFYWNGLVRFWDLRDPSDVVDDVRFEGRTRQVAGAGLPLYWLMLALAVVGLFLFRRRKGLVRPVLAIALAASLVHTSVSLTRYRSVLEPLIVILACAAAWELYERWRGVPRPPSVPA